MLLFFFPDCKLNCAETRINFKMMITDKKICQRIGSKKNHHHQVQTSKIHKTKGNKNNSKLLRKYLTVRNEDDFAHSVILGKQEKVHALFNLIQKRKIFKKNESILQARYNIKPLSVYLKKLDNLDVHVHRKDSKHSAVVQKEIVEGKTNISKENSMLFKKYKIKSFTIVLKKLDNLDVQRETNVCRHLTVSQKHVMVHNKDVLQGKVQKIGGNQDDSTLLKKLINSDVPRSAYDLKYSALSKKHVKVQNRELIKKKSQKMKLHQAIPGSKNEYSPQYNSLPLHFYVSN